MDVEAVVRSISDALGDAVLFIGGVAVETYVAYRRTHDIDLVVREMDMHTLKSLLRSSGFLHSRSAHLRKHVFKHRERGEVDAYTDRIGDVQVDEGIFERAKRRDFTGTSVLVPCLEDLILLKISSGREMDLADVAVLVFEFRDKIDFAAVERSLGADLRSSMRFLPDSLPMEYGWTSRGKLKRWVSERWSYRYGQR